MNLKSYRILDLLLVQVVLQSVKANYEKVVVVKDETIVREQLIEISEQLFKLQVSLGDFHERYNNQKILIRSLEAKLFMDFQEDDESVCERITGMFNFTSRKYKSFENRIIINLDEVLEEHTTHFEDFMLKLRSIKDCPKIEPKIDLSPILKTLSELSEKVKKFENKFKNLDLLEQQFNLQKTNFNKYIENQSKLLQETNLKILKNKEKFDESNRKLTSLKDLEKKFEHEVTTIRPRLPKDLIYGLSAANITKLK